MEVDLYSHSWKPGRIPMLGTQLFQKPLQPLLWVRLTQLSQHRIQVLYLLLYSNTSLICIHVPLRSHRRLPLPLLVLSLHHCFCYGMMHLPWAWDKQFSTSMLASDILIQLLETGKPLKHRSCLRSLIQIQSTFEDDRFQVHQKLFGKENSAYNLPAWAPRSLKAVLALSDGWQKYIAKE